MTTDAIPQVADSGSATATMPVQDILDNYRPAYPSGGTWEDTFSYLLNSPSESAIISEIIRQACNVGEFREPVLLETQQFRDQDEDASDDKLLVMDGTHRMCAANLMGWETVKVRHEFPRGEALMSEEHLIAITHIDLTPLRERLDEELYDDLTNRLVSFALDDDLWMRSSVVFGTGRRMELMWDNDPATIDTTVAMRINDKVRDLMLTHVGEHVQVRTVLENQDGVEMPFPAN